MKLRFFGALLACMSVLFFTPSYAQTAPVPDDTTARVAQNLVNQVSAANFKAVAEHPATANNILSQAAASAASTMLQDAAASASRRNAIADAALAVSLKAFQTMDPKESLALAKGMAADQAQQMMQLLSAISAGGVGMKGMQTVPPITAPGPATQ